MKFLFIIFSLFISTYTLHAQTYQVSGSVQGADKTPLEGCSVWFLQADTLAGGCITDHRGNFALQGLPEGEYICRVSMVGFKQADYAFKLVGKIQIPAFTLTEDPTQLSEVKVTADRRNIVKSSAGSLTYTLSEHAKQSATAYEALMEVPRLRIDPLRREILLDSGESPLVLIDGVRREGYIDVLNPEIMESVEVVEVPSARYMGDESTTCVLNIHLKRNKMLPYVNGSVSMSHSVASKYGVGTFNLEVGDSVSSLYLLLQDFYYKDDMSDFYSESQSGDLLRKQTARSEYNCNMIYAGLGGDRIFSDKDYAAFSLSYITQPTQTRNDEQGYAEYLSDGRRSAMSGYQKSDNDFHMVGADVYYKHSFSQNHTLELTGNYSYNGRGSWGERDETNDFFRNHHVIDLDNSYHAGKLNVDYTKVFQSKHALSAGSNTSYSTTDIDDRIDGLPSFLYNRWKEYLYVGVDNNRSAGKFKYTVSLGLDMMFSKADGVKNHYIDVLPSVALTYQFSQVHALTLSYNRLRFSPSLSMLNPRNLSTDSLYIQQGNPFLTPSYQDKVRLSYRLNYKKLFFEPYFTYLYSSKLISAIGFVKDNIYTNTYKNFLCANIITAGASVNYNLPFGNLSLNSSYQKRYQNGMMFEGSTWNTSFAGNFWYKNFSGYISLGYTNASYGRNEKSESGPWSNLSISWNLPKGWQLSFNGQNFLFPAMKYKVWTQQENYYSYTASRMTDRTPMFVLGIRYSFKNKVTQKWRQKKQFYGRDNTLQGITVQ